MKLKFAVPTIAVVALRAGGRRAGRRRLAESEHGP